MLTGSILNETSEAPSREICLDTWKSIVANDAMTINPKYLEPFSYKPYCKQILTLNEYPKIAMDKASQRRMLIIRTRKSTSEEERSELFRVQFERDKEALVSFMLTGLYKLRENRFKLYRGDAQSESDMLYQNESTIADYYQDCLSVTNEENDFTSNADLFDTYCNWRVENARGAKEFTRSTFSKKLNNFLIMKKQAARSQTKSVQGRTIRGFKGVKINPKWQEDLDKMRQSNINFHRL